MGFADYAVLIGYFGVLIAIGVISSLRIKKQEDFFMGGRSFGKLLQTFAAFGAGTGSSDPVNTARTTFTSGMSGMWSVMYWLFVTPFYWITGVWYRRMRHLTLGDWFVERYQSRSLGAGYCVFGLLFFMLYGSMLFSAIGKVAAPLMNVQPFELFGIAFDEMNIQYLLVPVIGVVVLLYGILGGLRAAYITDLIQGVCIILLSILLIPSGLEALVNKFGDPATQSTMDGFRIMHERLPEENFSVVGSATTSEFPLHRIIAVVLINLMGIVVQPHFIATGGGSAKTETTARVGLVTGNFLKRFCTVGWMLTALIALTLYADNPNLLNDPDRAWGVASRELLGPGLTGLMLACLLAALMSSADAYMIVGSGLVVRNIYAPYIDPHASEKRYVLVARLTSAIVIVGAVLISLSIMNVFEQLQLTWVFPVLFAAPFWIGMYWRRATTTAAWTTVIFCALMFFGIPFFAPRIAPALRSNPDYLTTNQMVQITTTRKAAPTDVARRDAEIREWQQQKEQIDKLSDGEEKEQALRELGPQPQPLTLDSTVTDVQTIGGQSVFWGDGVKPVDSAGNVLTDVKPKPVGEPEQVDANTTKIVLQYEDGVRLQGFGNFKLDYLAYKLVGVDLTQMASATLSTLELPPKMITPFLVMILLSLITRRNDKEALDRYYAKMKTPVDPDREQDLKNLELARQQPEKLEAKKLFPGTNLEFQKPTLFDVIGFVVCVAVCFAIVGMAVLVAQIGS